MVGMGPRKKPKTDPKAPADASDPGQESDRNAPDINLSIQEPVKGETPHVPLSEASSIDSSVASDRTTATSAPSGTSLGKRAGRKWLSGSGSWRSKAPPSVKSSSESIGVGVAGGAATELPNEDAKSSHSRSPAKFLSKRRSSKGTAIPAATTKFHVSSDGPIEQTNQPQLEPEPKPEPEAQAEHVSLNNTIEPAPATGNPPLPPLPPDPAKKNKTLPLSAFGWRAWWSRPDGYSDPARTKETEAAQAMPLPGPTPSEQIDGQSKELGDDPIPQTTVEGQAHQGAENKDAPESTVADQDTEMKVASENRVVDQDTEMKDVPAPDQNESAKNVTNSSWFWLWSSSQNAQTVPQAPTTSEQALSGTSSAKPETEPVPTQSNSPKPETEPVSQESESAIEGGSPADNTASESPKPSGWAFWFSAKPKTEDTPSEGTAVKQVGEVAVFDTPSQSNPEAAQFNEQELPEEESPKEYVKQATEKSIAKRSFMSLRGRPKTKQTPAETLKGNAVDTPSSSKTVTPSMTTPAHSPARDATQASQSIPKSQKSKQESPNLLFPLFENTYHLVQRPTYWQQIRQYFLGGESAMPHLHINPAPPRIKKAIAIGVHGFFPAPILQRVLGQPTGTSIRFATAAKKAIDDWTEARGYSAEVEQIALEGEGFVSERVNTLWKLLLNWIEHIKAADFILVACHSQGVPVAIMLIAKLIQFGCVSSARIGVCAMAGVNLGPFIEYKTKYFGPTAAELFEFSNPKSLVSQMYLAALDEVLRYGIRILYVGSIDDQLVSLESSTFSTISHPYIYRAVFVDGRIHAPDFLTHLVGFALKLRNLGLPDHGLVRELSPALAGSLYGGEGHSRIYDEARVYELAVQHALQTTSLPISPQQRRPSTGVSLKGINIPVPGAKPDDKDPYALRVKDYEAVGSGNPPNPYFLPWAMRGLLEEEFVRKELGSEVEELLAMFEEWMPQTKQLKEVKFRLEAVRSRL